MMGMCTAWYVPTVHYAISHQHSNGFTRGTPFEMIGFITRRNICLSESVTTCLFGVLGELCFCVPFVRFRRSINNSAVTVDPGAQLGRAHTELTTALTEGRAGSHNPDTTGTQLAHQTYPQPVMSRNRP